MEELEIKTQKINENMPNFNTMWRLPMDKLVEICEKFILKNTTLRYMFDNKHPKKQIYKKVTLIDCPVTPYEIEYAIRFYDDVYHEKSTLKINAAEDTVSDSDIDFKITPYKVTLFEKREDGKKLEKLSIDFAEFYKEYTND